MGDLNRDGKVDVVVADWCTAKLSCSSGKAAR